jgi:glycosyltransferase involved in cell wall biosynthesis
MLDASAKPTWSEVIAAADVVVPSPTTDADAVLAVMSAGRAVVAPANPTTVRLLLPGSAGLLYQQGDVKALAAAISRLLTTPLFRYQIATRAMEAARRHYLERVRYHQARERTQI